MFERVLVAIDESEISERVLAAAQDLAMLASGEIWVIHVVEREPSKFTSSPTESTDHARAIIDAAVGKLTSVGLSAHGEVGHTIYGYAAQEIMNFAKANDIGVIVMGSRGRGDLAGLLVGSTAHKVIHLADRPVVVVR
jgi:nucleotide-binding universal stress UspA family protein